MVCQTKQIWNNNNNNNNGSFHFGCQRITYNHEQSLEHVSVDHYDILNQLTFHGRFMEKSTKIERKTFNENKNEFS